MTSGVTRLTGVIRVDGTEGGEGGEEEGEGEGKLSRTGWMDGRADGRTSDIEGSIRGPRGPKK